MKILSYNEKNETLFVQFDTKYIWDYRPVIIEMYADLLKDTKTREKRFIRMIRNNFLVGSIKEVNNDFKC